MYKRSLLGVAWMLIKPLMQLAVFALVFGMLLPTGIDNFPAFLFTGIIAWTWFESSLHQAAASIVTNRPLLRQPNFPVGILPIVSIGSGLVHFCVSLPIVFFVGSRLSFHPIMAALPLVMLIQLLFIAGFSYFMAALNVTFRDTQHTLQILLQMMMYVSGIFYDYQVLPDQFRQWLMLNPVLQIITAYRNILLDGVEPQWLPLIIIGTLSLALVPAGYSLFKRQSYRFVEEV